MKITVGIAWRLVGALVVTVCSLTLASTLLTVHSQRSTLLSELFDRAEAVSIATAEAAMLPLLLDSPQLLSEVVERAQDYTDVVSIRVIDANGQAAYRVGTRPSLAEPLEYPHPLRLGGGHTGMIEQADLPFLVTTMPIWRRDSFEMPKEQEGAPETLGAIEMVFSLQRQLAKVAAMQSRMLGFAMGASVIFVLLGYLLVHRQLVVPIGELRQQARAVGAGNLDVRSAVERRDELGDLSRAFNDMAKNLQQSRAWLLDSNRAYARINNVMSSMIDAMVVLDARGLIVDANPATAGLLGYSSEQVCGQPWTFVFSDDEPLGMPERFEAFLADPVLRNYDARYRDVHGATIDVSLRCGPIVVDEGVLQGVVCVATDIRIRKEQERKLADMAEQLQAHAKDLERANADLADFAYVASHDLKAPLRGLANLAIWIEEDLVGVELPGVVSNARLMRSRVSRMTNLIDDLLAYSRAGRSESEVREVNVRELVGLVVDLIQPPVGIEVSIAEELPILTTAKAPLEQAFVNLITNAIKYHDRPERGRIEVGVRPEDGWYEFFVLDDGPGIPEAHHDQVFGMFQRLRAHEAVDGTGMGLAVVKKLVVSAGGEMKLESAGRGCRFSFTWPVQWPL